MIRKNFTWFENKAGLIWRVAPAKSILVILPKGCGESKIISSIEKHIKKEFHLHEGDEKYAFKVFKMTPDSTGSTKHFVEKLIRSFEKFTGEISGALEEEAPIDKLAAGIDYLLDKKVYPILLINRFHSFASIKDDDLLSTLNGLREMEHDGKVTSIMLSPMNYNVLRSQMKIELGNSLPFINSPYGDNHEKIIIEPLRRDDFMAYATSHGINASEANGLYLIGGGPDLVYEQLVYQTMLGTEDVLATCVKECSSVLDELLKDCELSNRYDLLMRFSENSAKSTDLAFVDDVDLKGFFIQSKDELNNRLVPKILREHIIRKNVRSSVKNLIHIFDMSIDTLVRVDENEEIEFKETFFVQTQNLSNDTRSTKNPTKKNGVIVCAAIREVAGFLNSRDGTLLIGVADGKNTNSKKPEIRGIENDKFDGDYDKYLLDITTELISHLGNAGADQVRVKLESLDGQTVCRLDCTKGEREVYVKEFREEKKSGVVKKRDVAFARNGSQTNELNPKEWTDWIGKNF